jgi:uncharacterized membrane protein
MNRNEFFTALSKALSVLPPAEVDKAVNYYNEIFDDHLEEGMSEEAVIAGLEPVDTIARRIIDETPIQTLIKHKARSMHIGGKVMNIVLLVLGFPLWFPILMSLLAILLSIYIVIWSLVIVVYSIVLALGVAALTGVFGSIVGFINHPVIGILMIGGGLACAGLAILSFYPALWISKGLIHLTVLLARKVRSLFLRKEVA